VRFQKALGEEDIKHERIRGCKFSCFLEDASVTAYSAPTEKEIFN
jgi:hypothetical protein